MTLETARPPIAPDVVQQHVDQASRRLVDCNADGLIVFRNTNILAFCGTPLGPTDRLVCGLINQDGQVALVVPAFEANMAGPLPPGGEVVTWAEHEDPYAAAAEAARRLGIETGRIVLDNYMWLSAQKRLAAALPGATLLADVDLIDGIRMIKTADEVAAIRAACEDTAKIYPLVAKRLRPGISEVELQVEVIGPLERAGLTPYGDLIQGGQTASVPHQPTGSRRFCNGDAVIVDFVCARDGYLGDMTRTFAVDGISDEIKRAYRAVRDAQRAAFDAIRPGVTCESIDAAARSVIEKAGLGEFFTHRLGHGIGLDVHEPPYFVRGNEERLKPGMCVTVEPGVYVPGRFGIRIEDVIVVTDTGCEVLSAAAPTDFSTAFD